MTATTTFPLELGDGPFAVSTRGLIKRYGPIRALDGLDLTVPEHAAYVLVGPNGAGKSTLLRILMGLARRHDGAVSVAGVDPAADGAAVRARVGYVPEDHRLGYRWMTVGQLIQHYQAYFSTWDVAYARRLLEAYEVDPARRCGALSKGQSRRVQLLLALAHRPAVLLLDEPTDGLDHVVRDATLSLLSEHLADTPTTLLISTHRVYEVERLVDHVGIVNGGKLLTQLPLERLRGNLLRYRADVPDGWAGTPKLNGQVIRRAGGRREIEWTVWGDRAEVTHRLSRAGASVQDVTSLSVDEAAIALLSR